LTLACAIFSEPCEIMISLKRMFIWKLVHNSFDKSANSRLCVFTWLVC